MKLKNIFRLPYGYVEEKSFESKETQINEKFDENSEINLRQDEKDKEHDQEVENLKERDKGHDQEVENLKERDKGLNEAIKNLMNSDKALDQKINSLNDKVDLINNNGNNNGNEINDLKAKDLEHDQAINDLKATDINLSQKIDSKLDTSAYTDEKKSFALKTELPSIEGLAKENEVNKSLALKADKTEISDMATKEWVNGQNFLTAHQDISSKADKTYVDEVSTKLGSIKLEKNNSLQYSLMIGEELKGTIDIPKDQFLKSVSFVEETNSLKFIFSTLDDENKEVLIDIKKLSDVYSNGNGIDLNGNVFSVKINPLTEKYLVLSSEGLSIKGVDEALALKTDLTEHVRVKNLVQENLKIKANKTDVEESLALKADKTEISDMATKEWVNGQNFLTAHQDISSKADKTYVDEKLALKANQENLNALNTLVGKVSNTLKTQIETETAERKENDKDVVKTTAIPSEDMPNRKAIVMENNDALMGKSSSGKVNIAMVSKYDVADFGSKAVHCNLNGKYPRPTYNDNQPIAIFEDIENSKEYAKTQLEVLMTKISQLEDKLSKYGEDGANKINGSADIISHNDANNNVVISGTFSNDVSVIGKDVIIKDLNTTSGKNHRFSSEYGEVSLKNCNYSGEHPKSVSNTEIGIQCNDVVNVKNCKFNTNTYNQLEVSLDSKHTVKGVNIDNCIFGGKKSNNAMSIFGLKDNAVINITNCIFDDVSNPLRISNHSNAKNVIINIVDCKVNKWESNLDYHGFICFQDYTSGTKEDEAANKQFSTMTVNFVNLTTPEGKLLPMKEQSEYCGSKNDKQLIYVYYNKTGLIPYSKDIYPTVNIK